jgi:hypothetical protein
MMRPNRDFVTTNTVFGKIKARKKIRAFTVVESIRIAYPQIDEFIENGFVILKTIFHVS